MEFLPHYEDYTQAYEVLSDSQKRSQYDMFGHAGVEGTAGAQGFNFRGGGFGDMFGDIFEDFFGGSAGARSGSRQQQGSDLRFNMEISFEESIQGKETKVKIPKLESCSDCGGNGSRKGMGLKDCSNCHGSGKVRFQQGFFTISQACGQCRGQGQVITDPCSSCNGEGKVQLEKMLSLKIPPGVETGSRLRLTGEGEAGLNGGPPGDLYVFLSVREHPFFVREGDNILCEIHISFVQATLGAKINVPTLKEKTLIKIPPGTQSGEVFRFRGLGSPSVRGHGVGDQLVKINVDIPTKLTPKQRELLEAFSQTTGENLKHHSEGILGKVKHFFDS